eukprot:TRINITY_DN5081_c0_g1_i2.p1 TRINITY_DN5081_c0_g1~~TRINITY_DN5081_c0_g1_i2.p1  ORF type:complete len:117 (+),score=20.32 TRINITY_DN5081_c0_g1_i2:456-806(+)
MVELYALDFSCFLSTMLIPPLALVIAPVSGVISIATLRPLTMRQFVTWNTISVSNAVFSALYLLFSGHSDSAPFGLMFALIAIKYFSCLVATEALAIAEHVPSRAPEKPRDEFSDR